MSRANARRLLSALPPAVYIVAIYTFIFLPVVVLVLFSFQDGRLPVPPLKGLSTRWYEAIFADRDLMGALGNSIVVAVVSSLIAMILGFLGAHALARHRLPGATFLQWLLMAPLSVSYLIIAMGLLITFTSAGVPKSLWAVGIGHVVINMPLCFGICLSQMGGHQVSAERAARDLGASEFKVILLISLPMLWPALLASFFLSFTLSWDEFVIAWLVSRFEVTLPVEIWSLLRGGLNPKTNAIGTVVFAISMALLVVIEVLLSRRRKAS
ncbi:MAG: ABC transporter permease [Pseudomonadota bacterium]